MINGKHTIDNEFSYLILACKFPIYMMMNKFSLKSSFILLLMILFLFSCRSDKKGETGNTDETITNGSATGESAENADIVSRSRDRHIKMKNLFGVNAFEWDFLQDPKDGNDHLHIFEPKMQLMKTFSQVRHYVDWQRIENTKGVYSFNPTTLGGWNYDAVYARSKMEGIDILFCMKNSPDWLYNTYPAGQRDYDNTPVAYNKNRLQPKSYIEQAKAIYQFVARYGSNKNIDTADMVLHRTPRWPGDQVNQAKVGLDLVKYVECANEPDKWWKGKNAQQSASEYAANLSAFYDGHKGKLGKYVGAKTADPNIKVVMGGIARPDINFIKEMVEWCKKNRGYKADGSIDLCFDVINFHYYSNDNTGWLKKLRIKRQSGVAPELTDLGEIADNFVQFAGKLGKDIEVWNTETGYDLRAESIQAAVAIGSKSILLTQADWILRTSLMYARHGVNRVFFYIAYDTDAPGTKSEYPFGTSGLLTEGARRPAADYILQVTKLMGEYMYNNTLNDDPIVDVYTYQNKKMYVLVVPDQKDRKEDYELDLKKAKKARVYYLKPGADEMTSKDFDTNNGILELEVTETPVFVEAL